MTRWIIVPKFYEKRHAGGDKSQRSKCLLNALSRRYDIKLVYTDHPKLHPSDIALVYGVPYHNRPKIPPGLLDTEAKLIGYYEDLSCWGNKECLKNKSLLFDRYNVLMGACPKTFKELYSQYEHKYIYFPNFFFPFKRYERLSLKGDRIMKCLMAGALNAYYPSRVYIYKDSRRRKFKLLDVKRIPFVEYVEQLSRYFCAIATPGKDGNVVAKYLEIPAAGVLMLAETVVELEMLGLKPNVHYVPITRANAVDRIREVLAHPHVFTEIRDRATAYVRKHHSEINRVVQFRKILSYAEEI